MSDTERKELRDIVRSSLTKSADRHAQRGETVDAPAFDVETWRLLSRQIGVTAMLVPEACGGAGAEFADVAIIMEEVGSALASVPLLSTVGFAVPLLAAAPRTDYVAALLERVAGGSVSATVCWPDVSLIDRLTDDVSWTAKDFTAVVPTVSAPDSADPPVPGGDDGCPQRASGAIFSINGSTDRVLDGAIADLLFLTAATREGVSLFVVDAAAGLGVSREPMTTLDLGRGMARIELTDAPGHLVCGPDATAGAMSLGFDLALVSMAAEQVGMAQNRLDAAVAHAKERVQFGRAIGSFQAVKHKLVDMLLEVEMARSAMMHAVTAADAHLAFGEVESAGALRAAASMAKAMCAETATSVSYESLHIFGGMGFTWEHDAHLYYRRAKSTELMLGDPSYHRARLTAAVVDQQG